jgi:thioesterase domain-containing protein
MLADARTARSDATLAGVRGMDFGGRGLILIGSPIWLRGPAPPVAELLANADFTGCSVVLFFTYGQACSPRLIASCRDAIRRRGGRFLGWLAWRSGADEATRRRMLGEVEAALAVHAASWRQLASAEVTTRRDSPTPGSSLLVTLRAQGSRPPLFIVTSGHGDVLALSGLSQRLDPGQPVYALQPPIDVDPEVAGSVDPALHHTRLARDYVEAMAPVLGQDCRPVQLAGYSAGCFIAAAVADRLRSVGRPAEQLILLEPPPPLWTFDQRVFALAKRLVRRFYPRPDRRLPRSLHVYHAYFTDEGFAHTLHAAIEYQPRSCATRVTLVLAEDALMRFSRRRLGWRRAGLAAPRLLWVPGDHFSLLRRPHVDELGQTLRGLLAPSETTERA